MGKHKQENTPGNLVVGVDFGTDSVRALVVDASDGTELGAGVAHYLRWKEGKYCDPNRQQFRQHPNDYLESMEQAIRSALSQAGPGSGEKVKGLSCDTTGSTPVLADGNGRPLSLNRDYADEPDAMFILWKDHTAIREAEEINRKASESGSGVLRYIGGIYSSEWFWAKALHVIRNNPRVAKAASTIVEHCDWISAVLSGTETPNAIRRSRCAAGHKALWHKSFGGYGTEKFLDLLDPALIPLARSLGTETHTADEAAGKISAEWAARLGISTECIIGVGAIDVHMGALGGGIEAFSMIKVIGTSCCDVIIAPPPAEGKKELVVEGICGQVDGSVVPNYIGYEAGQSAYGDLFAWFRNLISWPFRAIRPASLQSGKPGAELPRHDSFFDDSLTENILPLLEIEAAKLVPSEDNPISLDWMNGRRSPDANQALSGAISGLRLGTDAPRIYLSLVEATAYGSRAIAERFEQSGIPIRSVIAVGGIARKSRLVMQVLADVLNRPIRVGASDQACALGAAMFAATASGLYPDVEKAKDHMFPGFDIEYKPRAEMVPVYDRLYARYLALADFVEAQP